MPARSVASVAIAVVLGAIAGAGLRAGVVLNEIYYNQPGVREELEFIELHNPDSQGVEIGGWKLVDGVSFTFPAGSTIPAGGYLVVSASLGEFLAAFPGVRTAGVYEGKLSNSGERLALADADGHVVDEVRFDDDPDWPLAADGDGASLELRDPSKPRSIPWNWGAGEPPTPGEPNGSAGAFEIPAAPYDVRLRPERVTSADRVTVRARVFAEAPVESVVARLLRGPGTTDIPLHDDGAAPDAVAGDGEWSGDLGSFPDKTFARVKVVVVDAAGTEHVRPEGDDESDWEAFFVDDGGLPTRAPVIWLYLSDEKLRTLAQNAQVRSFGDPRYPRFDETFPGYVVLDGIVHRKVEIRHRGGFASRHAGGLKYSWRFELAPWDEYHGREILLIIGNMHWDDAWMRGDNGLQDKLCYWTFDRAGVPSPRTRFIRLMVNGELFGYHVEVEAVDQNFLERNGFTGIGDQYKHGRTFQAHHYPLSANEYSRAYEKQNNDRNDYSSMRAFCEGLSTATRRGTTGIRDFLDQNVDEDNYRRYLTGIILATHWDSTNNNIQVYRNDLDGDRWVRFPWDMDITWGYSRRKRPPAQGHNLHPYDGSNSNPEPNEFGTSALRDAWLKVPELREAIHDSLAEAIVTYFTESEIHPIVDRILAEDGDESQLDIDKWNALDRTWNWFPFAFHARYDKTYVSSRRKYLAEFLGRAPLLSQAKVEPRSPGENDDLEFTVNALGNRYDGANDLGPSNLEHVMLHLQTGDDETTYEMAEVDPRINDFWRVTVPATAARGRIWYRFSALDDGGREGVLPDPAHDGFEYFVLDLAEADPGPGEIVLNEIQYNARWYDVEFVEIASNLWRAIDLEGWSLSEEEPGGDENVFVFPPGSILDPNGYIVVSRDTRAVFEYYGITNLAPADLPFSLGNGGGTLILRNAEGEIVDLMSWDDAAPWPEAADGGGPSLERIDARSPRGDASAWAASKGQGTPGRLNSVSEPIRPPQPDDPPDQRPTFHRGDVDGSGALDLTDPVAILQYLFLGGASPRCREAADPNNDGHVDLADPVALLAFLFQGGPPPASPGPPESPCDVDPDAIGGPGDLGCEEYPACD